MPHVVLDVELDISTLLTGITSSVFGGELPTTPDNCIMVLGTGGLGPEHTFGAQRPIYTQPMVQIYVRHLVRATALSWMEGVKTALDGLKNTTINGHLYMIILQEGDVIPLGRDENKRHILTLKFSIMVNGWAS